MPKSLEELRRHIAAALRDKKNAVIPVELGARIIAASQQGDGWIWPVVVAKAGWGHAQFLGPEEFAGKPQYIPSDVLPQIAAAMKGARFRRRHPLDHEGDGNGLPELVAGWVENPRVVGDEVHADVHLLPTETEMRARLLAAREAGQMELFNVSILAYFRFRLDRIEGREALVAEKVGKVVALDMCAEPGWGGKFLEMRMAASGVGIGDLLAAELSHDELRSRLYEALRKKFGERDGSSLYWPTEVFDDYAIVRGPEGKLFRIAYALDLEKNPQLGDPAEVEIEYVAAGAAPKNSPGGNAGRKNDGRPQGADRNQKGASMKNRIIALLAALATFAQERAEKLRTGLEALPEADLPKRFEDVVDAFVECSNGAYINANTGKNADPALIARVQAAFAELAKQVKEQGGEIMVKAQAALAQAEKIQFTNLVDRKLKDAALPAEAETIVRAHLKTPAEEAAVDAEIKAVRDAFASFTKIGKVSDDPAINLGLDSRDKVQLAMDGLLGVKAAQGDTKVTPFRSIKQAYIFVTGDHDLLFGRGGQGGFGRVRAAIATADFPNILLNSMTKKLIQDYAEVGMGGLEKLITVASLNDYKTQDRVRMGYLGDLATVAEAAAYAEITKPTDDKVSYAPTKRGGLLTISEETIRNDDLGKIAAFPMRLARAARRTLKQFITDFFITNPNFDPDGTAWFVAGHNNLGSVALSDAELDAREIVLMKQTEKDSAKRLGLPLEWIMVPVDLKASASQINNNNDGANSWYHRFGMNEQAPENIIVNELLTDVTDWYGGSFQGPILEIGFLDGRQEPAILLANNPETGTLFTNDQVQYKVKHVYGGDIIDFRPVFKNAVAG